MFLFRFVRSFVVVYIYASWEREREIEGGQEEEGGEGQGDKMRGGGSGNDRNEIVQELKPAKISQMNTMGG